MPLGPLRRRRPVRRSLLRRSVAGAIVAGVLATAPVPSPVHVQPGAAELDGAVSWTPAVQRVTGAPGEHVAVDLALDDGSEHDVDAELHVRQVEIDDVAGPRVAGPSDALRIVAGRIALRPGERGALRAVAVVPAEPTVVAVEAQLVGDGDARPTALILLAPEGRNPELSTSVSLDGTRADVRISNGSPFPALVDVAVAGATWLGPRDDVQIGDVLVAARGERRVAVELSLGVGRRSVEVAAGARGAPAGEAARASASAWPQRTLLVTGTAILVLLLAFTTVRVVRRS